MADYGIKISIPGADVRYASDYDLLFSSSWPSLLVILDEIVVGPVNYKHNKGFPPLTFIYQNGLRYFPTVTKDNIQVNLTGDVRIVCHNIDLSVNKDYPPVKVSASVVRYDGLDDYGIKISKDGKKIDSKDMRDFILHSRCKSPQVLSIVTEVSKGTYIRSDGATINDCIYYTNKSGFIPWVYGYAGWDPNFLPGGIHDNNIEYAFAPLSGQSYPITYTDSDKLTTYIQTAPHASRVTLVMLRDPLFTANQVSVNY